MLPLINIPLLITLSHGILPGSNISGEKCYGIHIFFPHLKVLTQTREDTSFCHSKYCFYLQMRLQCTFNFFLIIQSVSLEWNLQLQIFQLNNSAERFNSFVSFEHTCNSLIKLILTIYMLYLRFDSFVGFRSFHYELNNKSFLDLSVCAMQSHCMLQKLKWERCIWYRWPCHSNTVDYLFYASDCVNMNSNVIC